ncbi:MAG: TetR/AcrR family transcriptional regulator [Syntrophomonadaceae bacterium]|nr:TetR/AcrR family transcriptional regulator [Syntrophomonadaceae bacterium]
MIILIEYMVADGGVRIKRLDPAARILESAEALFARKGYDAVSIREIAQLAQVQSSTIYYYFNDKSGVFQSILENALQELTKILESVAGDGDDPYCKFEKFVRSYTEFLRKKQNLAQLVMQVIFFEESAFKYLVNQYWVKHYLIAEGILREGVEKGVFRLIDTRLLTVFIRGMILWYFMSSPITDLFPGMENHREEYGDKLAGEILDVFLHGILRDG